MEWKREDPRMYRVYQWLLKQSKIQRVSVIYTKSKLTWLYDVLKPNFTTFQNVPKLLLNLKVVKSKPKIIFSFFSQRFSHNRWNTLYVCVCVRKRERERERESVCVSPLSFDVIWDKWFFWWPLCVSPLSFDVIWDKWFFWWPLWTERLKMKRREREYWCACVKESIVVCVCVCVCVRERERRQCDGAMKQLIKKMQDLFLQMESLKYMRMAFCVNRNLSQLRPNF